MRLTPFFLRCVPGSVRFVVLSLALSVTALAPGPLAADSGSDLCEISTQALQKASTIRGLHPLRPVPCSIEDKDVVRKFLEETIARDFGPDRLAMEQRIYRAIGMIPDEYDYGKGMIEFVVSQLGGYYDPRSKRFVMAAWLPAVVQEPVAVHELTHALQDQHFDVNSLLEAESKNSDLSMARSALVEGDATAVMIDSERAAQGFVPLQRERSVNGMIFQQILGMNIGGNSGTVPQSLKAMMIFPYSSGLRFIHRVLQKGGYAEVTKVFKNPPRSSREILHPDDYWSHNWRSRVPEPREISRESGNELPEYSDVIGEFGVSSLFVNGRKSKAVGVEAAAGWVGDRVGVFPARNGTRAIVWLTRWETDTDTQQFYDGYRGFIEERYSAKIGAELVALSGVKSMRIERREKEVVIEVVVKEG